ncbi:hypothetical protein O9929_08515 [Vibrio lentus]|nr:hypothetical protein [Vibrio lentus]
MIAPSEASRFRCTNGTLSLLDNKLWFSNIDDYITAEIRAEGEATIAVQHIKVEELAAKTLAANRYLTCQSLMSVKCL